MYCIVESWLYLREGLEAFTYNPASLLVPTFSIRTPTPFPLSSLGNAFLFENILDLFISILALRHSEEEPLPSFLLDSLHLSRPS